MNIEVALLPTSAARADVLRPDVLALVGAAPRPLSEGQELNVRGSPLLAAHVKHVRLFDVASAAAAAGAPPFVHVHQLYDEDAAEEDADNEGGAVAFQLWTLPAAEFDGLWESLVYDDEVQPRLLRYVSTAMRFSELGVDARVIAWNRVVLLHGPPGTGKTSLCKGLAHKLAVRMSGTYAQGHLIEVNAHSLFSKWFSESGKLVMSMFARIREILDDDDGFVCVLIDEVESLTAARQAAVSGSEPSDAVRVVNALLTQLDQLRKYKNALVLTTSNITGAIDDAFVDRADIKQYIGPPGVLARYRILVGCVHELGRVGVIAPFEALYDEASLRSMLPSPPPTYEQLAALPDDGSIARSRHSMALHAIAAACEGMSGRALRKLPFLAHALRAPPTDGPIALPLYLAALYATVHDEIGARQELGVPPPPAAAGS